VKILGIQKHHNSSACLLDEGQLIYYNQEERLSRVKKDSGFPLYCLQQIKEICDEVDCLVITGYDFNSAENSLIIRTMEKIGIHSKNGWFSFYKPHHLSHAGKAFYSSGFDEALVVVSDGKGSMFTLDNGGYAYETTSIYLAKYPNTFQLLYKRLYTELDGVKKLSKFSDPDRKTLISQIPDSIVEIENIYDTGHFYEYICEHIGLGSDESGKMMGLQSYGKYNENIPNLVMNSKINRNIFRKSESYQLDTELFPILKNEDGNLTNIIDFAYHTQKAFEEISLKRLNKFLELTKCKKMILTGGTALNVVANNHFRKKIPADIEIYIEPICSDDGNCIGAAKLYDSIHNKKFENINENTLYLGPKPNYEFILFDSELCEENVTATEIAHLLQQGNIISLFQGGSEAGPRALGNRSILFDPRVGNGKDIVNTVKKREWFRPFACSILSEHSRSWFDMHCLDESPYMMYALDALPGIKEKIPAVVHVDNTCRVQTVTREQNKHFYELIEEFYKLTGVPLLLNTSFNLAGDPLVETIEDALNTLRKSELEYLYLPEIGKLIYIKNENKQLKQGD
jgi:carbamoyltransferase